MTQTPSSDVLALLDRLVRFPTVSDRSNLDLIEYVETYLAGHGAKCHRFPNATGDKAALLASFGPADRSGIVLSGHSDVVPVEGQAWSSDPFVMKLAGGRAYGRGTVDMKGFLALALALAPTLAAASLTTPVHILISYDEETTCLGVCDAIAAFGRDLPRPKAAIVGEPTGFEVADAHKGVCVYTTIVHGRAAHSAKPALGANAILGAAALVAELERIGEDVMALGDPTGRFDPPYSTVHVGRIDGGTALNIIPKECRIDWEIRPVPGQDPHPVLSRLDAFAQEQVVSKLRQTAPEALVETQTVVEVPGLAPEPGSPAETLALRLAGRNATVSVSFATEAGRFQEAGIPTIVCGPGAIAQAHQPDEFVELSQLAAGEAFMQRLAEWCRTN